MLIKEQITVYLESKGFNRSKGPNLASKDYESAVGPRTATIWLSKPRAETGEVWLTADFFSEGRNILSTCTQAIPMTVDAEICMSSVAMFVRNIEDYIADSHAVRLLRKPTSALANLEPNS